MKSIEKFDAKDPESQDPFGNHAVVLGGDFCQTLPVVRGGSREQKLNATIKRSYLWPLMRQFKLTKNLRANADAQEFAKFVRNVGRDFPNSDEPEGYCRLPKKICTGRPLSEKIFGPLMRDRNFTKINETAILAPLNATVEEINEDSTC
jgi:hypothetical protein